MKERLANIGMGLAGSALGGKFYHRVCRPIDRVLIPLTKGRLALGPPGQTVLITMLGARSGKRRQAVVAFQWQADEMVIIASKGGSPRHPAWYHNLKAHPNVTVQYRGVREERVAREATADERDRLYDRMAAEFGTFSAYQERAGPRRIPVMLLARPAS
ncbi:MAG: nitroreductase family deazaflavin-dependent oxidoreductase [Deltaproteobacteria bacterium]|nr:nitroreductase family deazaflavin-dependent oxidoreductase [Deltaproteobacteria bacterium]